MECYVYFFRTLASKAKSRRTSLKSKFHSQLWYSFSSPQLSLTDFLWSQESSISQNKKRVNQCIPERREAETAQSLSYLDVLLLDEWWWIFSARE